MRTVLQRLRLHGAVWYASRLLMIAAAILAAVVVSSLTIDVGPIARPFAERFLTEQTSRPVQIGGLQINLLAGALLGRVELTDVRIAGRAPADRPFFTAKRLLVSIDWATALARRPIINITSVQLIDWDMLVEKWPDGDSFPRFKRRTRTSNGPARVTALVRDFRGSHGRFAYEDHETPWSVVAPNIDLNIWNFPKYNGFVTSSAGTIAIQRYVPMSSDLKIEFVIDGEILHLRHIDMKTDGARSTAAGDLDMAHWPEQSYNVKSHVQFQRMRELFFANESWPIAGEGDFAGVFHLFKGGHDLTGRFTSDLAGVYDYRFPSLYGALHWNKNAFDISSAGSKFFGGDAAFTFSIRPLRGRERPVARFDVSYTGVDVAALTAFQQLPGVQFAGTASGRNLLEWPLGRTRDRHGDGELVVTAPAGSALMTDSLAAARTLPALNYQAQRAPPVPLVSPLPVAGAVSYRFDPETVFLEGGRFVTAGTHVTFDGATAWTDHADLAFHVTSRDWQESQLVLAGIMTDFGASTGPVPFGGRGQFDGRMTGPFKKPRVIGEFVGEDLRAWDTLWGDGSARIVVENNYVTVNDGVVRRDGSEIRADGRFSLGYPRRDAGEELDARIRVVRRDVESLRHAFDIDDYPVSGLLTGEFHLTGQYEHPFGFGSMTIAPGVAYSEPFEQASASLRFDGTGVRLDGITIDKGAGAMTGAAYVGWDATYSFNAEADGIPMAEVAAFAYPELAPTGMLEFTAAGNGTFDVPRYDVRFQVHDLAVVDESVGQVKGELALRGEELSGGFDVASPTLGVTGNGRIALTPGWDSDLTFRVHNISLDPYVHLFVPQFLPLTTASASGSIRVTGALADIDRVVVDATVDRLDMRLYDYPIQNAAPIRLTMDQHVVRVRDLQLIGDDTRLTVGGTVGLHDQQIALQASGEANLGILQGVFREVRGSGRAQLSAAVNGPLFEPTFSGSATITNGRIRSLSLPNGLDAINGTVRFDARGLSLDDVTATLGDGRIQFGGRVGLDGYLPGDLNVVARGEDMHLRYPEGVRSTVDADLTIRGNVKAPIVGGLVTVKTALWNRRIDPTAELFDFGGGQRASAAGGVAPTPLPIAFDLEVLIPGTLRVDNNLARLWASADLQLRGSYERPLLFGRADVDRGEFTFEGRRYLITKGAIEFTNPLRIDPFFDMEAETRVRVPGQTYQVIARATGPFDRLQLSMESDPPLPEPDVVALLFSNVPRDPTTAEIRALRSPNERETDILATRATQILANPISSGVGRVMEQTFGVDTFQLSPSLIDLSNQTTVQRVNPSARVTIGKRVSDRVYLTFSRSLNTSSADQIVLLEYDENDRLSWILSRNEDQTYAIEVRVRHVF